MANKLKFSKSKSQFLTTTRNRVDQYFIDEKISKHANWLMWLKAFLFLGGFFMTYIIILTDVLTLSGVIGLCLLLGIFSAFVGFNICHDAIHGSYSANKNVNRLFSNLFHFVGANPYMWNITHNIVHHTYTNISGHDEDLEIAPGLIRLSNDVPANRLHKFQHWYAFALYSLASLSWVFRKDYKKFFQPQVGQILNNHPKIEYFNLFFFKALYLCIFIAVPMLLIAAPWWHVLIGFLIMHAAQGFTMGLVFQLAHVVEGTDFPMPDTLGNMEEVWAVHQMHTTANFAGNNVFAAFFLGGLNRQIEHHLFPKICHVHYKKIGVIVKQTALEFGIPYIESPTFACALRSHFRMLRKFSVKI
jgi:linoleoyl-CoA desaturase